MFVLDEWWMEDDNKWSASEHFTYYYIAIYTVDGMLTTNYCTPIDGVRVNLLHNVVYCKEIVLSISVQMRSINQLA